MSKPTLHDILHILRNPHGWTPDAIRAAQLKACDLLEPAAVPARELIAAAQAVVWFDWSDNDDDAVAAIERLRRALPPPPAADK